MAWKQRHEIDEMATTDMVTNIIIKYQQRHGLLSNVGSETTIFEIQTRDMCAPPHLPHQGFTTCGCMWFLLCMLIINTFVPQ